MWTGVHGRQQPNTRRSVSGSKRRTPSRRIVFTLGILSLLLCGFLGPVAWYMGAEDLDKMRRGVMDKSGYGVTQAGYILGIIATILTVIGTVISCLYCILWVMLFGVAAGGGLGH
jgi:hypothetical protein